MSKIEKRPYAGNWSPDILNIKRRYTTWTPDAIVLFNGDTKLPGCNACKNKIDFQAFITSVNCSAGTDSGGSSADISLAIPSHYGDSIFKDGEFVIQTGVEVNIYYRGFFEISGLHPEDEKVSEYIGGENVEFDLNKVEMRPYYPVFHGVVTSVSFAFSGGFFSASLSCANILHFWGNQKITTSAAYMAAKPSASRGSVRFDGHIYTNMTPHQIIYDLYRDSAGSADGVGWTFSRKDNTKATTSGTSESLFSLSLAYWNNRFAQGAYSLRMYGASGAVYTGLQTTFLGNSIAKSKTLHKISSTAKKTKGSSEFPISTKIKLIERDESKRVLRQPDMDLLPALPGSSNGVSVADQKAFITDISAMGSFELFDTQYDTKLGIAGTVADKAGYEFYQDVDGSLVFKPPFYNLDTSSSRIYRIENEDILDISFENQEPEYTFAICKGGLFRNTAGLGMEGTWGVKSTYVDYRLVAKYGWKVLEFDTTFFNNKTAAYYAAVVELEKSNINVNGCSVSIPLRPEMRPGYPVYIPYIDCFYYVTAISHSFSFGSDCTTSLTLTARRKKFHAPGDKSKNGIEGVDLSNPALPPKSLVMKDARGHYKTKGFPNVVMALDPTKLNPNHTFFRMDFHAGLTSNNNKVRQTFKKALVLQGYEMGILKLSGNADLNPREDDAFFNGPWTLTVDSGGDPHTVELGLDKKSKEINGTSALREMAQAREKKKTDAIKGKNRKDYSAIEKEAVEEYYTTRKKYKEGTEGFTVIDLIDAIADKNPTGGQSEKPNDTSNLLKLLDDKKSSFNPNLPGYYRYYSSSHSDAEQQGPAELITEDNGNLVSMAQSRLDATESFQFFNKAGNNTLSDEVEIRKTKATFGFKTKTKYYKNTPAIVATKDILHLSFQYHGVFKPRTGSYTKIKKSRSGKYFFRLIRTAVSKGVRTAFGKQTTISSSKLISNVFKRNNNITGELGKAEVRFTGETVSITKHANVNKEDIKGIINQTSKGINYALKNDHPLIFTNSKGLTEEQFTAEVTKIISDLEKLLTHISIPALSDKDKGTATFTKSPKFHGYVSPIFPISDENGYEVFGAYQYGRGLDIIPNAEFDSLLKMDKTQILTNSESDALLEGISSNKTREDAFKTAAKSVHERLKGAGKGVLKDAYFRLTQKTLPTDDASIQAGIANALESSDRGKQVVANTPTRLRDLNPLVQDKASCDCRADNADIQIILAEEFIQFKQGEDVDESAIVKQQKAKIKGKVKDWQEHQSSLQGEEDISLSAPLPVNILERLSGGIDDLDRLSDFPVPKPPKD